MQDITTKQWQNDGGTPIQEFREIRLWLKFGPDNLEHSGQADVYYVRGESALIIDYKTGREEAPVSPRNQQLRDLAVLVHGNHGCRTVTVAVVQPWVTAEPDLCVYTEGDLRRAREELEARVTKSNALNAPRIPGDVQCKFCRAKGICPEYGQWAGSKLPLVPASILEVPMAHWSPEQCSTFLAGRAAAQKWMDDAYDLIKVRLMSNGEEIPGWGLKEGAVRSAVTDAQALFDRLVASFGKEFHGADILAHFMTCITVNKTKLKEVVHKLSGLKGMALDKELERLLMGLTEEKQNQPSIERKDSK